MEIIRFGPGFRRPGGPPGTKGLTGQVILHDPRAQVSELAFQRFAMIAPHSNANNTALFIVISGAGWVQVGDERVRVNHGEACLTLTERSAGGHRHASQISLPGGAIDETDDGPITAALREANEEVGLDPVQAGVTVAGVLPMVDVRVSGFVVHPVIAFADRAPHLVPDGYEVAEVLTAPLAAFLPGAPIEIVTEERDGFRLRYGGYRIGRHLVWGATAGILGRLGAYLGEVSRTAA